MTANNQFENHNIFYTINMAMASVSIFLFVNYSNKIAST